jgi:hypothetical protein
MAYEDRSDEDLRQSYLALVNSDDAWYSGKDALAEPLKKELDRRGVELYPGNQ